ncbi:MAG: VWA domain-containing protein [Thermosphaera sp.]
MEEEVRGVLKGIDYKNPLALYRGWKIRRIVDYLNGKGSKIPLNLAIDTFYVFYLPVPMISEDADPTSRNYQVIKSLIKSPSLYSVKSRTLIDPFMSGLAASVFLAEYKTLEETVQKTRSSAPSESAVDKREASEVRNIVEKAIVSTMVDIEHVRRVRSIMEGLEPGRVSQLSFEEYGPELLKLARNTDVRRILKVIEGLKPWELGLKRKSERHKHGEIGGYELGRDIERLTPSARVLPEELFFLRFLSSRLLLYEKRVEESLGPIYVLLDKCLDAEALVEAASGDRKAIKNIEVGEEVASVAFTRDGKPFLSRARVVKVFRDFKDLYALKTGEEVIKASSNHLVPVLERGSLVLKPVRDIRPGDFLYVYDARSPDGEGFKPKRVVEKVYAGAGEVYDLRLDRDHLFIANSFVVHNSGSMDGVKMTWAKAVALGLYVRAVREHREFYIRFFDSQPYPLIKVSRRPKAKEVVELMNYIARIKGNGGTDISRALITATTDIRTGSSGEASDIVLITDGVDRIAEQHVLYNLKKAGANLYSVMIMGENSSLKKVSTRYFSVERLGRTSALKIIEVK